MVAALANYVAARIELLKVNLASGLSATSDKYQGLAQETATRVAKQIDSVWEDRLRYSYHDPQSHHRWRNQHEHVHT